MSPACGGHRELHDGVSGVPEGSRWRASLSISAQVATRLWRHRGRACLSTHNVGAARLGQHPGVLITTEARIGAKKEAGAAIAEKGADPEVSATAVAGRGIPAPWGIGRATGGSKVLAKIAAATTVTVAFNQGDEQHTVHSFGGKDP